MSEAVHCFKWTDELTARLLELQAAGYSTADMARRLGKGCTRNAVCGRIYRLRQRDWAVPAAKPRPAPKAPPKLKDKTVSLSPLALGEVPFAKRGRSYNRKGPARPRAVKPEAPLPPDEGMKVTLMGLTQRTCRWPIGDPGHPDFGFCGHGPQSGSSYCAFHAQRAIRPCHERREANKLPPIPLPNFNGLSK